MQFRLDDIPVQMLSPNMLSISAWSERTLKPDPPRQEMGEKVPFSDFARARWLPVSRSFGREFLLTDSNPRSWA